MSRNKIRNAFMAVVVACAASISVAQPAAATYRFVEDDFVSGGTTHATFGGSWNGGKSGLVRWWEDDDNGVGRGELMATSLVRAKPGRNPKCIAVRVRWQRITGSVSAGLPTSAGATVGISETGDGYTVSCRSSTSSTPPLPIYMDGHNASGRTLIGAKIDVCHKKTPSHLWVCATDANEYGGRSADPGVKNQAPVALANSMGFTFRPADPIGTQKCNSINVLGNDSDPDGDPLTAVTTGANFTNNAPNGTYFTMDPNGTFSICVTRGAANSFSPANPLLVSYVATDNEGASSEPVNVVIAPSLVNAAPVALANSMGFTFRPADPIGTQKCNSINVLGNDSDPDGDPLTAVTTGANFTNNAPNGTYFTMDPNGTFSICVTRGAASSFSPANPLLVSYVATDSQGAQSQPVNVVITPSLVNAAPVALANSMGFTFRPADPIGTQKCNSINVLGNDSDPDGDPLTAVTTGANFTNNAPNGTYFTMQPNGTFSICVTRGAANSFSPANPLLVSYVATDNQGAQSQPVNIFITPSLV